MKAESLGHPDQGTLTSPSLNAMLQNAMATTYPEINVAGLDKTGLLKAVFEVHGWPAVMGLGRGIRPLIGQHTVLRALIACADPEEVLHRWMRLEQFGHTRHRTVFVGPAQRDEHVVMTIQHIALDGGAIEPVHDVFVWGLLLGLLEAAGVTVQEAALVAEDAAFSLEGPQTVTTSNLPAVTHTCRLTVSGDPIPPPELPSVEGEDDRLISARLSALLHQDLLRRWQVGSAARALGLSGRALQRSLTAEATTFTQVVRRARVDAAQQLLRETPLKLTEVAFCVGFADHAHFTRAFRRLCDVPPSIYRDLL